LKEKKASQVDEFKRVKWARLTSDIRNAPTEGGG
jgi:hypothetical protein